MDQAMITAYGSLISAAVTAVATIFLWRVTKTLAIETKRMVEASSRPHVVATIEASRWSMMHSELTVTNTGNATAYAIKLKFDPGIPPDENTSEDANLPLENISVLKPGQSMASYLCEFGPIIETKFQVEISWLRAPSDNVRERNIYSLDMTNLKGIVQLGASEPIVQIAQDFRKFTEDWKPVASGSRHLSADVFTEADRERARQEHQERRLQAQRAREERLSGQADT